MMIIELEEVKEWLRIDDHSDDESLTRLIKFAERYIQNATGKEFDSTNEIAKECCLVIIQQRYDGLKMKDFRDEIHYYIEQLTYCESGD